MDGKNNDYKYYSLLNGWFFGGLVGTLLLRSDTVEIASIVTSFRHLPGIILYATESPKNRPVSQ